MQRIRSERCAICEQASCSTLCSAWANAYTALKTKGILLPWLYAPSGRRSCPVHVLLSPVSSAMPALDGWPLTLYKDKKFVVFNICLLDCHPKQLQVSSRQRRSLWLSVGMIKSVTRPLLWYLSILFLNIFTLAFTQPACYLFHASITMNVQFVTITLLR